MNVLIQPLKPSYYHDVEEQLKRLFYKILYAPILKVIKARNDQSALQNAPDDPLRSALRSGRVQYNDGTFSGEFNAAISKALKRLGADFIRTSKTFFLFPNLVPGWVIAEATQYRHKAEGAHDEIIRALNETTEHLSRIVDENEVDPSRSLSQIEYGFKDAAELIKVQPTLSEEGKDQLKREYSTNMKIWIKKFSSDEIKALREKVEQNATQGYRFDRLISSIMARQSVSQNKAKFLARQETSLFLAKFREKRFLDAGVRSYRWMTAHDSNVRSSHKHLDGQVFLYSEPPITDPATGARNNPGQDYNCRCIDRPILERGD